MKLKRILKIFTKKRKKVTHKPQKSIIWYYADAPWLNKPLKNKTMKTIILIAGLLVTSIAQAQFRAGIGAGWDLDNNVIVSSLDASYESPVGITIGATLTPSLTRYVNAGNYAGINVGYNIAGTGIIPAVGAYYNFMASDQHSDMNQWRIGYSLKLQRLVSERSGVFLNGMISKSVQVSGGIYYKF